MFSKFPLSRLIPSASWLEKSQSSILSAATVITGASILSAIAGLLIKRLLLHTFFGTPAMQEALDAFWIAFQIPDLMFQLIILGAVSAAFIPIFTATKKENTEDAFKMTSIVMNCLLLLFLVLAIVVFIFAKEITLLRTGEKITPNQVEIITNLTRIMLVSQFFFAISNFLTGVLQSYHRFIIPAVAPIFYNIGILIGTIFLSSSMGIYGPATGVVIGAFFHMLIQLPLVKKLGYKHSFSLNLNFVNVKEFFKLTPPRVFTLGANEGRKLLLGFFTTSLGTLSYTMIYLALNLMVIPIRFFGTSISQAALPFLSAESGEKHLKKFRYLVLESLNQVAFLAMPASVLLLILRVPIVRIIFGVTDFPWSATLTTSRLVAVISISITAQALSQVLVRSFYALQDTKTPLLISIFDLLLYGILSSYFVFFTPLGLLGLAIVTTITAFSESILLLTLLNKKIKGLLSKAFLIPQLKMLTASFLMAVFLYLPFRILDELVFDTTKTIELLGLTITTGTIGMLVYTYFAAIFEIKELKLFNKVLNSISLWRKNLAKMPEVLNESPMEDNAI